MSKLNAKQQLFADHVLAGKSQIEAHRLAGYDGKNDNARRASASEILTNPNVAKYMQERRKAASDETEITAKWLIEKGVEILNSAQKDGQYAAATGALKELGVLSGVRVEKQKRESLNRSAEDFTDEELADFIKE